MTEATTARPDIHSSSQPSAGSGSGHSLAALLVIAGAQLMVVLDATIVNIALPHIRTALGFSQAGLSWVLNAYTLVFGGLLLLGGRTGDLFGRRRMFVIGVSLFAGASLLGGFAPDKGFLLAMRALQGVGGAIASPTALSLITVTFPEGNARNRAFGVYAAVSGAGAAIGLILGGVLVDALSWRWVLFVNAPIGLTLALLAPSVLPDTQRATGRLDLPGAMASTGAMAALVYGFINAATNGWASVGTVASFAVAAALIPVFVVVEMRSPAPIMPLRLFKDRTRVGSYVVMLVTGAGIFGMFFFLTQYIQEVKGFSPLTTGFAFLPASAIIVASAQVASRLVGRLGPRALIAAGAVLAAGGLGGLAQLGPHSSYLGSILPFLCVLGVGMGFIFVPITLAAVAGVAATDSGIASALLNVGQQVGGTIGLSALVTIFSTRFTSDVRASLARLARAHPGAALPARSATLPHPIFAHAYSSGADLAFYASAGLMVLALVAALALIAVTARQLEGASPLAGLGA